jgi:TolA-binding protein
MMKLKLTTAMFSLALLASPAFAQDFVEAKIQDLSSQGYTHFEVSRGWMRTEIEAYGPNLTKLEVQLSNADGSVVSQRTEIQSQVEYDENIREIALTSSNVRNESDDDTDDDTDDAFNDTDMDDDNDENHDSNGSDDNDSHDVDGHDNDSHDNDGHDGDGHDGDDD